MIIIQDNPALVLIDTPTASAWTDAITIDVSIGNVYGTYELTKVKADLTIIGNDLYMPLTAAETLALDPGVYGVFIQATWASDELNTWQEYLFQVRPQQGLGSLDTYASLDYAQEYFGLKRLVTDAWDVATDIQKTKSLVQATNIIDRLSFIDSKDDPNQVLQFPRTGQLAVPDAILIACCEIAYALLDGIDPEIEYENLYMLSQGYSTTRSSYDRSVKQHNVLSGVPSITAWRYLSPYLRDPNTVSLVRIS